MAGETKGPAFGDLVENGWASEDNPIRRGYFVRAFKRSGRMNPGLTWEITDGRGKFWEFKPGDIGDRLTVTPRALTAAEAEVARLREALEEIARGLVPPPQHGHYLAHRQCVKLARQALQQSGPLACRGEGDCIPELPCAETGPSPSSHEAQHSDGGGGLITVAERALAFIEDEADNRAAAGSEMSDYEREPRELADDLRMAIDMAAGVQSALLGSLKAIIASENGFYRVAMPSTLREAAREAIAKAEWK